MRTLALLSATLACVPDGVSAQGVPIRDASGIGRLTAILDAMGGDLAVQRETLSVAEQLARLEADQLQVLEGMTGAMSGQGHGVRDLEAHPAFPAAEVYPEVSGHPMDSRLFGEGRETVERMIVQVAGEYANAPGVRRAGLSPTEWRCLFQALIKQESRFSVTAQSPVGAYGLTQLMPGTAADLGVDRYDIMDNLRGGARYITTQLGTFGTIPHALAAYNAGPGRVHQYGGVPPFPETQGYVRNISRFYAEYLAVVGGADALGTLGTADFALAEYSNISDATLYFAADAHATTRQVVGRLAAIIRQIDDQPDVTAALELNTYARAELARILALRVRSMAATQMREAAHAQHLVVDRLEERAFMAMEVAR